MGFLQSIIMLAMMIIPIRSYVGTTTNVISFLNSGNLKLPSIPNRPNKLPFRWQMIRCAASSSSLCESSSSSSPSSISFLNGKTLVSVEECMNAYRIVHGLNADNLPQHDGDDSVGNNDNNNKSNDTSNGFIAENIGSDRNNGSKNDDDRIVFLDASWWHKGDFDGRELFELGPRIPGSKFIDVEDIAANNHMYPDLNPKNLPHMLPPKNLFAALMDVYNIRNSDHVVIYAREGAIFTPRTWFLFRSMGHNPQKIHLMQGSLEEWIDQGGQVDNTAATIVQRARNVVANISNNNDNDDDDISFYLANDSTNVCTMENVLDAIGGSEQYSSPILILDSRGSSFAQGQMPFAVHVPYRELIDENNALRMKNRRGLLEAFTKAGVDEDVLLAEDQTIVCSCGSGVSACHLFLALELCGRNVWNGNNNTLMYDGSWAEWRMEESNPKVVTDT